MIEGMFPTGSSLPIAISGTLPPGTALPVAQAAPAAASAPLVANVLSGSVLDDSTIITIPANRIWYGWIALTASLAGVSQIATITVNTTGATATPANSVDLLGISLQTGVTNVGVVSETRTPYMYIYAGTSAAALDVSIDGASSSTATAYGYLLS